MNPANFPPLPPPAHIKVYRDSQDFEYLRKPFFSEDQMYAFADEARKMTPEEPSFKGLHLFVFMSPGGQPIWKRVYPTNYPYLDDPKDRYVERERLPSSIAWHSPFIVNCSTGRVVKKKVVTDPRDSSLHISRNPKHLAMWVLEAFEHPEAEWVIGYNKHSSLKKSTMKYKIGLSSGEGGPSIPSWKYLQKNYSNIGEVEDDG